MLAKRPGAERQLKERTNLKVKLLKLNMMKKMIMAIAAMLITAGATAQETNQAQKGQENKLDRAILKLSDFSQQNKLLALIR